MAEGDIIAPIKPKKKRIPWWKKAMVIIPIIFLSTWALAMWNPLEGSEERPENVFDISGYTFFELDDGTYGTYVMANDNKIPVAFRLDPRNASEIYLEQEVIQPILNSAKVYITFNPNQENLAKIAVASAEIARITGLYGINTVGAYTEDSDPVNPNVPLKTCNDANNQTSIIIMEITDSTGVSLGENNCIHVKGETADDLILAADKLGFNLLGIKV